LTFVAGTNSLLDINVFGRRAGLAAEYAMAHEFAELPDEPTSLVNASVYRTEESLKQALHDLQALKACAARTRCGSTASTGWRARCFIFDSRDEGAEERLDILNDVEGVRRCRTTFNCTDACPRGIEVTKAIQEVKRALLFLRFRSCAARQSCARRSSADGIPTCE
jgi:succinate dehydrogenase/fumarate reductase-like Fe-S protein